MISCEINLAVLQMATLMGWDTKEPVLGLSLQLPTSCTHKSQFSFLTVQQTLSRLRRLYAAFLILSYYRAGKGSVQVIQLHHGHMAVNSEQKHKISLSSKADGMLIKVRYNLMLTALLSIEPTPV